jgi:hypothetical protein
MLQLAVAGETFGAQPPSCFFFFSIQYFFFFCNLQLQEKLLELSHHYARDRALLEEQQAQVLRLLALLVQTYLLY